MFTSVSVGLRVARDVGFVREVFRDDIALLLSSLVSRYVTSNLSVAPASTEVVPMGDVASGGLLYIKSSRQVRVLVSNGASVDQEITIGESATAEGVLLSKALFDGVKIHNAGASAVEVLVFLGGV